MFGRKVRNKLSTLRPERGEESRVINPETVKRAQPEQKKYYDKRKGVR